MNTHSSSDLDRKSLKRPDDFMVTVRAFFDSLAKHWRGFLAVLGVLFLVGVGLALYLNHREANDEKGRSALYLARQTLERELAALAPPVVENKDKDAAKDKKEELPPAERMAHAKLNVDAQLPQAMAQLKDVANTYKGSRPGYEAWLALGDLYYNHGQPDKAVSWYEGAADQAAAGFDKTMAFYALGYAQENSGHAKEAIQAYEKAINQGESGVKGDLLLSVARCYEGLHDVAKARATYDQVISQLPNTESSRTAERLKSQLE